MSAFKHTADLSQAFFEKLRAGCADLPCDPLHLLMVMYSESGVFAHAHNKNGHASGILQFMPAILQGLGWRQGSVVFRSLSPEEQLPFVFSYFKPWNKDGKPWASAERLYQATFLPGTLRWGNTPDLVLSAKGGTLGWAYQANAGFDRNGDLKITLGELGDAIRRNCKGPRWVEIVARLGGQEAPAEDPAALPDFGTVRGAQQALKDLGFYTGTVDGVRGPLTFDAISAFQVKHPGTGKKDGSPDGLYGQRTRDALEAAWRNLAQGNG